MSPREREPYVSHQAQQGPCHHAACMSAGPERVALHRAALRAREAACNLHACGADGPAFRTTIGPAFAV